MFVEVTFPLAYPFPLVYEVSEECSVSPGVRVLAPLKGKNRLGFISSVGCHPPSGIAVKKVEEILDEEPLLPENLVELLKWASSYYLEPLGLFFFCALPPYIRAGKNPPKVREYLKVKFVRDVPGLTEKQRDLLELLKEIKEVSVRDIELVWGFSRAVVSALRDKGAVKIERVKSLPPFSAVEEKIELTSSQKSAIERVKERLGSFCCFLLHGVTGSGKTEVYKELVFEVFQRGECALILVPEIALTPHYIKRFINTFGDKIAIFHSGLSPSERVRQWVRVKNGEARVAIGTRSAIFLPFSKLSLIVVDEEHDASYKQQETPRYNARDLAIVRASMEGCPVVLGSATPSLESFFNVKRKKYVYLSLPERVKGGRLPESVIVDMRKEVGIFSRYLLKELQRVLERGKKAMILINRKGYSRVVVCTSCGRSLKCPNCDVSLTPYKENGKFSLICHWCGFSGGTFFSCPHCGKPSLRLIGYGVQRVIEELNKYFPEAVIESMDRSVIHSKYAHAKILERMERGDIDILVGTQMIAKGHHFPQVELSVLLSADMGLNIPDFRASERTFQLICQMAGRAGREGYGKVIIQSFNPEHYAVVFGSKYDYLSFAKRELEIRKEFGFPPFSYLARLIAVGSNEGKVKEVASKIKFLIEEKATGVNVMGPSPAGVKKVKNKYRWHVVVKAEKRIHLLNAIKDVPVSIGSVRIFKDVDPYEFV